MSVTFTNISSSGEATVEVKTDQSNYVSALPQFEYLATNIFSILVLVLVKHFNAFLFFWTKPEHKSNTKSTDFTKQHYSTIILKY